MKDSKLILLLLLYLFTVILTTSCHSDETDELTWHTKYCNRPINITNRIFINRTIIQFLYTILNWQITCVNTNITHLIMHQMFLLIYLPAVVKLCSTTTTINSFHLVGHTMLHVYFQNLVSWSHNTS